MKFPCRATLGLSASIMFLCVAGALNTAAANGPPSFQLRCMPATNGVDQIICHNAALVAAYRTTVRGLEAKRAFYFEDSVGNGFPRVSAEFDAARKQWPSVCGVEWKLQAEPAASGASISCLLDMLWGANFDAHCPLIISLVGVPSPERQRAWFKQNEPFCLEEAKYYFGGAD